MKKLVYFLLVLSFSVFAAENKVFMKGKIVDSETGESLPMSTIYVYKHDLGTLANKDGIFEFYVPNQYLKDSCQINYLGYLSKRIPIESDTNILIKLEQEKLEIRGVTVRPKTPQDLIKEIVRKKHSLYAKRPYNSYVYFQDEVLENETHIKHEESLFEIYHASKGEDDQYRLLVKKEHDHVPMQFMEEKTNLDSVHKYLSISQFGLDAMNEVSKLNPEMEIFLDSTKFKYFQYEYDNTTEGTNIIISFKSKRKIDHVKVTGKIYVDPNDRVITGISSEGVYIIPFFLKPVLFIMGLKVKSPSFFGTRRYEKIKNAWHQKDVYANVEMTLVKVRWFKKNEHAFFQIKQSYVRKSTELNHVQEIPEEKRYKWGLDKKNPVYAKEGIDWQNLP